MKLLFVCFIVAFSLSRSVSACDDNAPVRMQEFQSRAEESRGTVLFIHGLNNKGTIFESFRGLFQAEGFDIAFLTLTAHSGEEADKYCASAERYENDFEQALRYLLNRYPQKKLFIVGFSLGGSLSTLGLKDFPTGVVSRMVLMAPALSVRRYTQLVRLTFPFAWMNFSLPSLAEARYTAYRSTPVRSHRASFRTMERAQEYLDTGPDLPPALVLIHAKDELVSPAGLKELIAGHRLQNWSVEEIQFERVNDEFTYHHLFAPETFSEADFLKLQEKIVNYFKATS